MDAMGWLMAVLLSAAAYGILIVAGRCVFEMGYGSERLRNPTLLSRRAVVARRVMRARTEGLSSFGKKSRHEVHKDDCRGITPGVRGRRHTDCLWTRRNRRA